jgi:hypothetical protein
MPDWGFQHNAEFIEGLKVGHSRLTNQHIIVLHRSSDAEYGICRFYFPGWVDGWNASDIGGLSSM